MHHVPGTAETCRRASGTAPVWAAGMMRSSAPAIACTGTSSAPSRPLNTAACFPSGEHGVGNGAQRRRHAVEPFELQQVLDHVAC